MTDNGNELLEDENGSHTRAPALFVVALMLANSAGAQTTAPIAEELAAVRVQLNEALLRKDRAFIERTLADEYYCIHSNGTVTRKADEVAAWMSITNLTAVKTMNDRVQAYGDIGIINGRTANEGTADGRPPAVSLFTDVFVKRDGRWQLAGCQATRVPSP